jgi:O-acetyl-ADP-ribose deacetylase (regulator of RNase III)
MPSRAYRIGPSTITLAFENILKADAQVLVSSDDYRLTMSGGVSAAILSGAGSRLAAEAQKAVPARAGEIVVTSAGSLPARFVFHAITIGPRDLDFPREAIVRQATQRAIQLLPLLNCRSIAFPAIGTGAAGIPFETAAAQMAGALVAGLLESPFELDVRLCLGLPTPGAETFFGLFESFAAKTLGLLASRAKAETSLDAPADDRGAQICGMLRHLDARRGKLEASLLAALTSEEPANEARLMTLRAQLSEIAELRLGYAAELTGEPRAVLARSGAVFLSSTSMDLKPHRHAVRQAIEGLGHRFIGMEDFAASEQPPATLIRRKVDEADHYVGVIGMRYGYVDPGSGLSMTELEYRQAVSSGKRVFLFVMDRDAPITAGMVETDPQGYGKLLEFRARIMKAHTCGLFRGPEDLTQKVESALKELRP